MSEVYRIGVAILLRDGMGPVLSRLSHQLLGVHKSVKDIEGGLNRWKLALGGAAAVVAGSGMLRGMAALVGHAKDLSHEIVQIEKLGVTVKQLAQVQGTAYRVARAVPGTKEAQPLEIYGAAYSMFGHENALRLMKPLAEFAQVTKNTTGKFDEDATKQLYQMLRSGDLMGKFTDHATHQVDIEKLTHFLDLGSRVMTATHGYVNAQTWLGLAQQGAPVLAGMTDRGLMEMGIIAQAMGGPRAGTALTSTYQQMVGGIMAQRVAQALTDIGLLGRNEYDVRRGGAVVLHRSASDRFSKMLHDPLDMLTKNIIPALSAHGMTDINSQSNYLFRMFGRATTQRMWSDFLRNQTQIQGEVGRMAGGMNINPARALANSKDLEQVQHNLTTAWDNMLTTIGKVGTGPAIAVMRELTGVMEGINRFANAHPTAIKIIGEGIAALGAALVGAGVTAIIAALGPAGWIAGGIIALGAALAAVPWKEVWTSLGNVISWVADKIVAAVNAIKAVIPGLGGGPSAVGPAKNGMGTDGAPLIPLGPRQPGYGKQGYNAVPPAAGGSRFASAGDIYMDGRKVGEIVSRHQAASANGPLQGSAYMDGTAIFTPADFAYARG